jgi:hypothetical protein
MKTAALATVSKRDSRPTGERPASAPLRTDWAERSNALVPAEQFGLRQKRHLTPGACQTPPHQSEILSFTPGYKPQIGKPGSFNPELCGGLRGSGTLAW